MRQHHENKSYKTLRNQIHSLDRILAAALGLRLLLGGYMWQNDKEKMTYPHLTENI